jgi:dTDP-4-amino-4,6-dideoxygalactose transaminase
MRNINLFVPKFRKDEIFEEMGQCLDKSWTGLGYKTTEFEDLWCEYTKLDNAHLVNSATSGLHLAIKVLKDVNKWSDDSEVITTPLTFVSSNHVILHSNLKPVFADVDEHLCLDPKSVRERITKKTKALIFVGMGGNVGGLSEIIDICIEKDIKIILDAAHMAGTRVNGSHVGSDVDVTVFSFQAVKNLPTADSGMICFKNKDYDTLCRKLSWLGINRDTYQRTNDKGSYKWEYDVLDSGYKYHGNSIIASMGIVGLRYLDEDNKFRRYVSGKYDEGLSGINGIELIPTHENCESSKHLYQIRVNNRDKLMEYLNMMGIYPGVHYRDNTNYRMYEYAKGTCPNSYKASEELISLPLHLHLTNEDIEYVIENVKNGLESI